MKYLITLIFLFSASNIQADTLLERLAKSIEKDIKHITITKAEQAIVNKEFEIHAKIDKKIMMKRLEVSHQIRGCEKLPGGAYKCKR